MSKKISRAFILFLAHGMVALMLCACGRSWSAPPASSSALPPLPPAAPLAPDADASEGAIRFLEDRVKRDPDDFIAYNKLCGYYLQRVRETGDVKYLELAERAAQASLKAIPAEQNTGGLTGLAQAEFTAHNFTGARDHALQLIELDPQKSYPYQILGDAFVELGDYDKAEENYQQMQHLSGQFSNSSVETRLARFAFLNGDIDQAQAHFSDALALALNQSPPPRETVAWCRWQLGEVAFARGDYEKAEAHYREALTTFPDYYRAVSSLGRVRAARGDLAGAIEQYEHAVRLLPDPNFVAALGDLYKLVGREKDASAQYALVEQIAHLSALNGQLYNRQLALFYADHDMKADEAYALASKEYEVRRDIYGADAVAWTALKAGKISEAQSAIKEALKLNTRDAKLFYHAGMIARVAGDKATAHDYLKRALSLNPQFDPLQAPIAQKALAE